MRAAGAADVGRDAAAGSLVVEPMSVDDGPTVLEIYGHGIAIGVATFETVVPEWRAWNASHRKDCRFVARLDDRVVGWTAVGKNRTDEPRRPSRSRARKNASARSSGNGSTREDIRARDESGVEIPLQHQHLGAARGIA